MKRRISVMTDLDMAEHYLGIGRYKRALSVSSVALENALNNLVMYEHRSTEHDLWTETVEHAYKVKSKALKGLQSEEIPKQTD